MQWNEGKSRRQFLISVTGALASASASASPRIRQAPEGESRSIAQVVDFILQEIGIPRVPKTVDTVKRGDPEQRLKGIATTFLATRTVIEKARNLGANLLITHEPTFYDHLDRVEALQGDPVYEAKNRFIRESGIVIWRFHDYWHQWKPDPIIYGLARRLGWAGRRVDPSNKRLYDIPPITFDEMCVLCKERLGIRHLRVLGNPKMICRRVALFAGWGGAMGEEQIQRLSRHEADVVICGESAEWTTCEYVRDALAQQINKGLIILGHANSEEPGMADLVEWLRARLPGVPVHHVPAGDPFRFV